MNYFRSRAIFFIFLQVLKISNQKTTLLQSVKDLLIESDFEIFKELEQEVHLDEYDFVIIGGGTAGCALASRLTEIPEWNVLLLEAGQAEEFYMDIPVLVGSLQRTSLDYQYLSEPSDSTCLAYHNNQCRIPRGKVLGGSSVLNYMLATRGNPADYNTWEAMGNPGWGFKDVLPYFIKAENMRIESLKNDSYHSTKGPLSITHLSYHSDLAKAFLEAGEELGHRIGDYNGASQTVFSYFQFTQNKGRRASNSRAYLHPRKNLHVRVNSTVTRIIIEGYEAKGVEFEKNGKKFLVKAMKEVIVSAGAINSPQILMLSGIGPKDHLESLGINVIKDLKVGYNLQDHVSLAGLTFVTNATAEDLQPSCIANNPKYMVDYIENGGGPWQVPGGNEAVFFYDPENPNDPNGLPELELHFSSESPIPEEEVRGFRPDVFNAVFSPIRNNTTWSMQPILMHPKSRGRILLASKNPYDKPKLIMNYLQDEEDVTMILKGIHKVMEISKTKAFQKFDSRLNKNSLPACKKYQYPSDEYWKCAMRQLTISNYHQSGTCKMGPENDTDAVVDSNLKVHGISKLRVVDASIMPRVVAAHTNVPTNMIAEKTADLIKRDYYGR